MDAMVKKSRKGSIKIINIRIPHGVELQGGTKVSIIWCLYVKKKVNKPKIMDRMLLVLN
jgi:hypothetical protein